MATTSQNARVQARVHSHFTSEELEFYAEDEHISIIPNFNSNVLHFLNGDFGPFHSNLGTDVPLWLALALKERRKCRIETPLWMSIDVLKATLSEERQVVDQFSQNVSLKKSEAHLFTLVPSQKNIFNLELSSNLT